MAACPGSLFTMNEKEVYYSWETKESGPGGDEYKPVQLREHTTNQSSAEDINDPQDIRGRYK